jgi:hypothetical protein
VGGLRSSGERENRDQKKGAKTQFYEWHNGALKIFDSWARVKGKSERICQGLAYEEINQTCSAPSY